MPILAISSRMTDFACLTSIRRSRPKRFVGSEPRKKLRQIAISGTVARSWKTVAMPASLASRGELKRRLPLQQQLALAVLVHAREILMNVDLPAPLSPSTQVTWPELTTVETSFSAITLPKYLLISRITSSSGAPFVCSHARPSAPADVGVDQHRGEQDHAEERESPVRVPAAELDPDERHAR